MRGVIVLLQMNKCLRNGQTMATTALNTLETLEKIKFLTQRDPTPTGQCTRMARKRLRQAAASV